MYSEWLKYTYLQLLTEASDCQLLVYNFPQAKIGLKHTWVNKMISHSFPCINV